MIGLCGRVASIIATSLHDHSNPPYDIFTGGYSSYSSCACCMCATKTSSTRAVMDTSLRPLADGIVDQA